MRTKKPIVIDGKLDDESWGKVPGVGAFRHNSNGSVSTSRTEAKIVYDDKFLYFSFFCEDDNIWSTLKRRDERLWEEEVVEVFLQANERQPSYIELEVNPLGTMLDIYLLDVRQPLLYESWNSRAIKWGVQVNGTIDGKGGDHWWSCEIALPLEDVATAPMLPPRVGDKWRLNLFRVEKLPTPAGTAWSPTYVNDFHKPRAFGVIIFTGKEI
ncbi:MAG: carbohydrate-binding family 9-like protein [Pyrinomonadaceae bacterium]